MNEDKDLPAEVIYREQVLDAGWTLLDGLHDITHHQGDGENLEFQVQLYGLDSMVETLRRIAESARRLAGTVIEGLDQAEAARAWLRSGWPRRCANCGEEITVDYAGDWQICRGRAEHTWCHRPGTTIEDEDARRAGVIEEDESAAYCEDRMRTGGPRHGDGVELTFPDGRQVQGTWYVPGPPPLGAPVVFDWYDDDTEIDMTGARVEVIELACACGAQVYSLQDLAEFERLFAELKALAPKDSDQ